jgi:hypothetical protein
MALTGKQNKQFEAALEEFEVDAGELRPTTQARNDGLRMILID